MKVWLLDTGPVVAALNRRDPDHGRCASRLASFSGQLLTTGAVITEAMHFLAPLPEGPATLVGFVEDAQIEVREWFRPERLRDAARLMEKYADAPMDFADATLVGLADETGVGEVLTLDERGFRTYRYRNTRRFELVLGDS